MVFSLPNIFKKRSSPENPGNSLATWVRNLIGGRTASGAIVNIEKATKLISIYACAKIISESLASLQIEVLKKDKSGDTVEAIGHPIHDLFKKGPSPLYSTNTFIETGTLHLVLNGNATAEIIEDPNGKIIELRLLDSRQCSGPVEINKKLIYKFQEQQYLPEEIIHVPNMSFTGFWGISPVDIARETIGVGLEAVTYAANLFNNGGALQGYLKHPTQITDKAANRIEGSWNQRYMGGSNAGKTPLLEEGMEFIPLTMTPADVKLIEQMKWVNQEVARLFRVPLHLIQDLERSTNNNIEQQSIDFVMHTIRPYVKRWEAELNRKLFSKSEQGKYFIRFNIDSLLRGDSKSRGEYLRTLYSIGVLSPNEIRKILKLNEIEGGDTYYHQGAMMSTEKINKDEQEEINA